MTDYHQDKLAMMMMVRMMLIFQRVPVEKINDIQLVLIEDIFGRIELSIQLDKTKATCPLETHCAL